MAKKKTDIKVKRFKDGSNNFWVGFLHYSIIGNKLTLCAGGQENEEHLTKIKAYLKRNKIDYEN